MDAAGVIAYYVMDGNRPLTATTGSDTTSYLYGLGVIGEESNAWSYGLTDGTNTQRQLTDALGEVTYSARYTPWGDTLESYGSGTFAFGYFGGLMDAATGLLYVGDGQYYDPSTGRFLTRGARPNSPNPYLPFDPTGALFLPLALVSLLYGRKRRKSKWDILVIVTLLSLSAGMGVAACQFTTNGYDVTATPSPTQPNTYNVTATPTTIPSSTPAPSNTPLPTITATCTLTPSPTPTPTPKDIATMPFPGGQAYDEYGAWGKTTQKYKEIRDWMIGNASGDLEPIPDSSGYGLRFKDSVLLTIIVTIEFRSYSDQRGIFSDLLGALYNQYQSPIFCGGNCDTVEKQLVWLSNKQGMRASSTDWIIRWYPKDRGWGSAVINGEYAGRRGWEWGNYKSNSLFRKNPAKYPHVNYLHREDGGYAGIVVFTAEQNLACRSVDCLGWNR
jgi:RHS repeat-associated protein